MKPKVLRFTARVGRDNHIMSCIGRLNARAGKLGLEELVKHVRGKEYKRKLYPERRQSPLVSVRDWEIMVPVIGKDGWHFVCALDPVPGGNVIRSISGESPPEEYRTAKADWCDHCKTRRARKSAFVLRHEDGQHVQVGSTCIMDFLGWPASTMLLLARLEPAYFEPRDPSEADERYECSYQPEHVVDVAARVIAKCGFVSSKAVDGCPTKFLVSDYFHANNKEARAWRKEIQETEPEYSAKEMMDWVREQPNTSDYVHNLKLLVDSHVVQHKHLGLLVSLPAAYARAMGIEAERAAKAESQGLVNEHVGVVKERLRGVDATVTHMFCGDSNFGTFYIISMVDGGGHTLVWKTSDGHGLHIGDKVTLDGTVKAHDEYRGTAQTVLTRCVIL